MGIDKWVNPINQTNRIRNQYFPVSGYIIPMQVVVKPIFPIIILARNHEFPKSRVTQFTLVVLFFPDIPIPEKGSRPNIAKDYQS